MSTSMSDLTISPEESMNIIEIDDPRLAELFKKIDVYTTDNPEATPEDVLTPEELDEFYELYEQQIGRNNYQLLDDIAAEAEDRIWYDRSNPISPKYSDETRKYITENQKRIIEQYDIDPDDCDDFYHGYWSGILALCRFFMGWTDDLDDLRSGDNGLLDT